jgi:hypothetical protein
MSASLPARPSLEWLRKTAKDRLSQLRRTDPTAKLADAQLAIARMYGFPSWRRLKLHVEREAEPSTQPVADELVRSVFRHVGRAARLDSSGWAETSIHVRNNPKCAEVVSYLETLQSRHAAE